MRVILKRSLWGDFMNMETVFLMEAFRIDKDDLVSFEYVDDEGETLEETMRVTEQPTDDGTLVLLVGVSEETGERVEHALDPNTKVSLLDYA
jgi:aryl-alcohol dehydrogenase-like predicted oxidoreductase